MFTRVCGTKRVLSGRRGLVCACVALPYLSLRGHEALVLPRTRSGAGRVRVEVLVVTLGDDPVLGPELGVVGLGLVRVDGAHVVHIRDSRATHVLQRDGRGEVEGRGGKLPREKRVLERGEG